MFIIFFRALTLFVLGGLIAYCVMHAVKYIKKKHDICFKYYCDSVCRYVMVYTLRLGGVKMKQTNVTHNIRVDKNKSNRAVYAVWCG